MLPPACGHLSPAEERRNEMFLLVQRLLQADVAAHPQDSAAAGVPCRTALVCLSVCL